MEILDSVSLISPWVMIPRHVTVNTQSPLTLYCMPSSCPFQGDNRERQAQNTAMRNGSRIAEVDALFAMYTDDFVYVLEGNGGTYTASSCINTRSDLPNPATISAPPTAVGYYELFRGRTRRPLNPCISQAEKRTGPCSSLPAIKCQR